MRFGQLKGLSGLPLGRVRRQFRNERVVAVLPVREDRTSCESLLVATSTALVVLTATEEGAAGHWMTRWAPWDVVRFMDDAEPGTARGARDEHRPMVLVDRGAFHVRVPGEIGKRALREFIAAAQARRMALGLSP
jgi:hypothetical protein